MKNAWFVTGTDTEIGKTFITCALLHAARQQGLRACGMKPIAAGTDDSGRNDDVEAILRASMPAPERGLANPYLFAPPIAPHIAARESGIEIDFAPIRSAFAQLAGEADVLIVEGAGGFRVPLGPAQDTADLAADLGLPVVLVVGMRLGCINHALLTAEAIERQGLQLAGWVANRIDPEMLRFEDNLEALHSRIAAPLLGVVPYIASGDPQEAASLLRLPGF